MRFTELSADEFQNALALLGEAFESLASSKLGENLLKDIQAGAGKQKDTDSAVAWGLGIVGKYLPEVLKHHVEDAYKVLAACDGQTLAEYREAFTPAKFAKDCRALTVALGEDGELREMFTGFFA